jgi:hypothetical protein
MNKWLNTNKDSSCPICRQEKIKTIFRDIYTYRQWKAQYSGIFESITRPSCEFAYIEIIEKLRNKRYLLKTRKNKILKDIMSL